MVYVFWYEEVVQFVCELVDLIFDYEIVCEYEYFNCFLIVYKKFKIGGEWWMWIDYNCFQEFIQEYEDSGGLKMFSVKDYMVRIFYWVLFGVNERGFDFKDIRYQRKNKLKVIFGC